MDKTTLILVLAGLALFFAQTPVFAGATLSYQTANQYAQDQILVKFKPGLAATVHAQISQNYGTQSIKALGNQPDLVLAKLTPGQTVEQAVRAYINDPNVEYAQPNYIYHTQVAPTDPQYGQVWAAKNAGQAVSGATYPFAYNGTPGNDMNLELAWSKKTDCSSVIVAVVDTGINYTSTDLAANMWVDSIDTKHGRNFVADVGTGVNSDPMDLNGHGTHVAGIIGAVGNNGVAGVGVCWLARLMAVRVLDANGSGYTSNIISGIDYAVTHGAKVINMSLGGGGGIDTLFNDAITRAQVANVLVVVAAGNSTSNNDTTPAWPCSFTNSNLICVAALDQNYSLASFSNYGLTSVDVGAPGANIYSTWAGATTNVIADFISGGGTPSGWSGSSTTSGGWGAATGGLLHVPATGWGTALYNANTDDRIYKTFNLAGVASPSLEVDIAINVKSGDYLKVNYNSAGGDPFAAGTNIFAITNVVSGLVKPRLKVGITPCASATCSIGFQLTSTTGSLRDIGSEMTNFKITTFVNNTTSYNTISGTSMASPEVAGVAALVWAYNPLYTYADVANAIKNGGRSISALSGKSTTGKAVDAMGSIAYINRPTGISVVVH